MQPSHVVGIGASAGGLDALERFFENLPPDTGMAYVLVQHLSPDFKSLIDELLARHTELPICPVENGMAVEDRSWARQREPFWRAHHEAWKIAT